MRSSAAATHLVGAARDVDGERCRRRRRGRPRRPPARERGGQASRLAVHPLGDVPQPLGAVVHGVHRRDDGEEHLRGADVGGGLLPADVLLARLQGEAVGGAAGGVDRHADEAAGHRAAERVAGGEEPGVGAAVAERHAEALRRADAHVGALLAGRGEERAGQQVGGDGDQPAGLVHGGDGGGEVAHHAGGAGVLQQRTEHGRRVERRRGRRRRARCRSARRGRRPRRSSAGASRRRRRTRTTACLVERRISVIASAAAVDSSSIDALAISIPVRSVTIVWKLRSASSRPWLISGWYGV